MNGRAMAWVAFGFALWVVGGFFLILWAIEHGLSPDEAASPFHLPGYAGMLALAIVTGAAAVRAQRRGDGWSGAFPEYGWLAAGSAIILAALVIDVGWREGIGIAFGIESSLAPSRVLLAVGLTLVAAAPLRTARRRGLGSVPLPVIAGSAALTIGLMCWPGGFHPAADPLLEPEPNRDDDVSELWVMDGDGSHQTRLVEASGDVGFGYVSFTPDGSRIVYTRFDTPSTDLEEATASIWIANADGSDPRPLVEGTDWNWIPRLSPDGAWLAFTREAPGGPWMQAGPAGPAPGGGPQDGGVDGPLSVPLPQAEIWRVPAAGGDAEQLTDSAGDDRAPVYSPDGTRILFDSTRDGNTEIYVMNADGSDQRALTHDPGEDWGASWSPDGTRISFNSTRGGGMEIFVMDADGSGVRQLTFDGSNGRVAATWSPDGGQIAFTDRDDEGIGHVRVIPATGGEPRDLSRSAVFGDEVWTGGWGANGRIAFARTPLHEPLATALVRQDLAAGSMAISALLLAGAVLLLGSLPVPLGTITAAVAIGVAIPSVLGDEPRFLPVGLALGIALDAVAWFAAARWRARLLGAVAAGGFVLAIGLAVFLSSGLGWSPTLLFGVATAAAAAGWAMGAMSDGWYAPSPAEPATA
jgi:hypothetical protein